MGAGSAELSSVRVPIFENSGQWAASSLPNDASESAQAVFPSAPPGQSEQPLGKVCTRERSGDPDGTLALSGCGTERSMSIPDAVSASPVVGCAVTLGLNSS